MEIWSQVRVPPIKRPQAAPHLTENRGPVAAQLGWALCLVVARTQKFIDSVGHSGVVAFYLRGSPSLLEVSLLITIPQGLFRFLP